MSSPLYYCTFRRKYYFIPLDKVSAINRPEGTHVWTQLAYSTSKGGPTNLLFLGTAHFLSFVLGAGVDWTSGRVSEKAMAPHSSTLAWKIPWTEEPGRLQSMGSQRVGFH